jgi:hypothetical protein
MINEKAQPIQFYPDELIGGMWVQWSEKFLFDISGEHLQSGFQKLIGSEGAHERTRAGEAYRLGLLKGRLIRERTGGPGLPLGWAALCAGEAVHSRLGYIAYVIGKALSEGSAEESINVGALNVLHFVFALSLGIKSDDTNFSVFLLYEHALRSYRGAIKPNVYENFEKDIKRWLAAAVFDTLDYSDYRDLITQPYVDGTPVDKLILMHKGDDGAVNKVFLTPKELVQLLSDNQMKISYHKASLYWANPDRGIYSRASLAADTFLDTLLVADQESFASEGISIFSSALEADSAEHLLLESLCGVFENHSDLVADWGKLMEKLTKGVYEALRYLEEGIPEPIPKIFYVHGVGSPIDPAATNIILVPKDETPIKPAAGSMMKIGDASFILREIKESGGKFEFTLDPAAEGQPA